MEQLEKLFPQLKEVIDPKLREGILKTWELARQHGGWKVDDLGQLPFTSLIKTGISLLEHTQRVTRMAMAAARERGDLNLDYVIAGGLLHDVGKLLEYERQGQEVVKSRFGKLIRHPVSGYALTVEAGIPPEVGHIVISHSEEGESVSRTAEAILIHHCDFIDFEIAKRREER